MNGRTKRLPVSGLCATRQRTKTAVTVISQPRPSWKVGRVTLVAEPATTHGGNSTGARLGHGGSSRNVTGFGRDRSYKVDEGLAVAVQGEQAAVTIGVV